MKKKARSKKRRAGDVKMEGKNEVVEAGKKEVVLVAKKNGEGEFKASQTASQTSVIAAENKTEVLDLTSGGEDVDEGYCYGTVMSTLVRPRVEKAATNSVETYDPITDRWKMVRICKSRTSCILGTLSISSESRT